MSLTSLVMALKDQLKTDTLREHNARLKLQVLFNTTIAPSSAPAPPLAHLMGSRGSMRAVAEVHAAAANVACATCLSERRRTRQVKHYKSKCDALRHEAAGMGRPATAAGVRAREAAETEALLDEVM